MVAALMVLDRGDGKNYFGLPKPRFKRSTGQWLKLERVGGYWRVIGETNYKPVAREGQMIVKVKE